MVVVMVVVGVGCAGGGGIDAWTAHEQTGTDDLGNPLQFYYTLDLCIDHCRKAFK